MSVLPRVLTAAVIVACGTLGVYGTLVAGFQNGLFDAISQSVGPGGRQPSYLGGPAPSRATFTGIEAIDSVLVGLVAFFTIMIDGPRSWDVILSNWYLIAQFCAGFSLLVLEGHRQGNRGRLVSWTGTVGTTIQRASYALCLPIYLILHLISSPVIHPSPGFETRLTVSGADLELIPFISTFFFWVPYVLMNLPSPSVLPPAAHYGWIAFWQPFPMWQSIWHWLLTQPLRSRSSANPLKAHLASAKWAYSYILGLAVISHLALLGVALVPESAVPEAWAPVFAEVDLVSAFVPHPPWKSPIAGSSASVSELSELTRHFLHWDIYPASVSIFAWALCLYGVGSGRSVLRILPKVFVWGLLGGPISAAVCLLWNRDDAVMSRALLAEKKDI